jgi:hypothetical protein
MILSRSLVLSDAARPAAALTAAPVYSFKQGDVTFEMHIVKTAGNSLQFNWPFFDEKRGGTRVSLPSISTFGSNSGYGGDKSPLVIHCQIR